VCAAIVAANDYHSIAEALTGSPRWCVRVKEKAFIDSNVS